MKGGLALFFVGVAFFILAVASDQSSVGFSPSGDMCPNEIDSEQPLSSLAPSNGYSQFIDYDFLIEEPTIKPKLDEQEYDAASFEGKQQILQDTEEVGDYIEQECEEECSAEAKSPSIETTRLLETRCQQLCEQAGWGKGSDGGDITCASQGLKEGSVSCAGVSPDEISITTIPGTSPGTVGIALTGSGKCNAKLAFTCECAGGGSVSYEVDVPPTDFIGEDEQPVDLGVMEEPEGEIIPDMPRDEPVEVEPLR